MTVLFFAALIMTCVFLSLRERDYTRNIVFAATSDDEDIKIAGSGFAPHSTAEDAADAAARQFLLEKNAGNIEKARTLGGAYAKTILELENNPELALPDERTMLETHHQLLLCSYAVNRVIAECSPNSIIAQTSLNVFYNEVETTDPELYKHISDMAAFSLYILGRREGGSGEAGIGKIYARLCGFDGDQAKINEGEHIYKRFYSFCSGEMDRAGYTDVTRE